MRIVFVVLYAVYGTALLFLAGASTITPMQLAVVGACARVLRRRLAGVVQPRARVENPHRVWRPDLDCLDGCTGFIVPQIAAWHDGEGGIGVILVGFVAILLTPRHCVHRRRGRVAAPRATARVA